MYAASTVAAACVRLAVAGVFGDSWCSRHSLDRRLLRITHSDQVSRQHIYSFMSNLTPCIISGPLRLVTFPIKNLTKK